MNPQWIQYKNIINTVVKPALGCTEPISAAYASAVAAQLLGETPEKLHVMVSDNLYKNSMGVFVPGTGEIGLAIASAVGAIGGDPEAQLEVLADITKEDVDQAKALIATGNVTVCRTDVEEFIYCKVEASSGNKKALVEISGGHTQVTKKILNDEVVFEQANNATQSTGSVCDGVDISIQSIYEYATQVDFDEIKFILESATLNSSLSQEGLKNEYGLQVGRTIQKSIDILGDSLATQVIMQTSAASDARMGGATLPAMSNFGSGNQGIAATIPVVVVAQHYQASEEKLARALIMSHLTAIYIKSYYPPLSAFCGNTVTSAAAAMAMTYLADGSFEQSCFAIQNVLSDCSGMVCDGAKSTCAMKVKTSTSAAVTGFIMALNSQEAHDQGIVAHSVEESIANIGRMVTHGMTGTDATIIDIMSAE
ncbi:MAG: serine dehydratase subunit alpha family protein [Vibrio sp.]